MRSRMLLKGKGVTMKGSFYIIKGVVFYNTIDSGLGHSSFWREIVETFFKRLDYKSYSELSDTCYAVDRGRVTLDEETGKYTLFGTPNCKKYIKTLKKIFRTNNKTKIVLNDEHYRIMKSDESVLKDYLSFGVLPKKGVFKYIEGGFFDKV